MRRLAQCLAIALLAGAAVVAVPTPPPIEAAGTPPACPWANSSNRYCNRYTTDNTHRSIGLLGDSVLLGSADGFSNPGLPRMLSDRGWGPINLIATLGMRVSSSDPNLSANYWVDRWQASSYAPEVIAVNLGANMIGTWNAPFCTPANTANCKTQIESLLNNIGPNTYVWWAKVNHEPFGKGNGYSQGMLGFNKALDDATLKYPNLMLWDWPTALLTANPAISMDTARVHPNSGVQYVKRSTLMANHITSMMSPSRFTGLRVTLPAGDGTGYGYSPVPATTFYATPTNGARLSANETRVVSLAGAPGYDSNAPAVALTVTASGPVGVGFLTVYRCGDALPTASNLNYFAGTPRTAQAIVRPNSSEEICIFSNQAVDIAVSIQGNFLAAGGNGFTPITPARPLDTRITGRSTDYAITVPGTSVVVAAVTVTAVKSPSGGNVTLFACGQPQSTVANVSFNAGEIVASAAFVPVAGDGKICAHVNTAAPQNTDVLVDVTGVFQAGTGLRFVPAPNTRTLDTRNGAGGWVNRHRYNQTIDTIVAPAGAKAVTGTITLVKPTHPGAFLTAYPCGALPTTSSVNAGAGQIMANSITVGVEPTQRRLCIYSAKNTNTLFDVAGWWVEAT